MKKPKLPKSWRDPVISWPITKEHYRQVLLRKRKQWERIQELRKLLQEIDDSRALYTAFSHEYLHGTDERAKKFFDLYIKCLVTLEKE